MMMATSVLVTRHMGARTVKYICDERTHFARTFPCYCFDYRNGRLIAYEYERCANCGLKREKEGGDVFTN